MVEKIKILICCHKDTEVCNNTIYLPIQVGHEISNIDLDMQKDDEVNGKKCENISSLNGIYCEMTAMYWAWKNIRKVYPDIEYLGLCHYRRYYIKRKRWLGVAFHYFLKKMKTCVKILLGLHVGVVAYDPQILVKNIKEGRLDTSNNRIKDFIEGSDIIATDPCRFVNISVGDFFKIIGKEHIDLLTSIICKEYPQYQEAYSKVLSGNLLYSANMIILKMDLLDDYCSFIFEILDKHRLLTITNNICNDPINEKVYSRVSGYLSELLTCTYILKNKKQYKLKILGKCFVQDL